MKGTKMKTTSILESMELSTRGGVTVQSSQPGRIVLSLDSGESNHSFYITATEATELAKLLNTVVAEQNDI